jgi:hypothetical protein
VPLTSDNVFDYEYAMGVEDFSELGPAVTPHPRVIGLNWSMKTGR